MIQRIQTLYLLIVAILMGLLCFFPLATLFALGGEVEITAFGVKQTLAGGEYMDRNIYMTILLAISALTPLVTIFCYKKRWLQVRLCMMELVFLLGMQTYVVMHIYKMYKMTGPVLDKMVLSVVDAFPLVGIIFTYLALRNIAKDIALLKSVDRIR